MGVEYSIILPLFGRYERLTYELQQKVNEIKALNGKNDMEVILVTDGPQWTAVPMVQLLPYSAKFIRVVGMAETTDIPAKLFNAGTRAAEGRYIIFSTLYGMNICSAYHMFKRYVDEQTDNREGTEGIFEAEKAMYLRPTQAREGVYFLDEALYGQCQTHDCLHMDEWCIPKKLWETMGGFHESSLLQEEFERYAALSFIRLAGAEEAGVIPQENASKPLSLYPFQRRLVHDRDMARRFAVFCNAISIPERSHTQCSEEFLADLPAEEKNAFAALEGLRPQRAAGPHYRIFVIGGYWEYHHNQLAFFNYLENLYGTGFATFRCGLDVLVQPPEVQGYDLVIFTRCRSDESVALMRHCKEQGIPTLYMIDDNWFSAAKEHPKFGEVFVPGNPNYDNFILALGLCKSTIVYNPVIRQDVLPYAANVQTFPISVCEYTFRCNNPRERRDEELLVGFAGSLRWNDMAFRALARLARRRKNVRVFLAGSLSREQELLFTGLPAIRLPKMSYVEYAKAMSRYRPDLLMAPLEDTHTMRSKCANKYIEGGIIGAAGVFSDLEPYRSAVKDGETGFLVKDDSEDGWYECLAAALQDIPRLRRVQEQVREDILDNYSVKKLLPLFKKKITSIIEEDELSDD